MTLENSIFAEADADLGDNDLELEMAENLTDALVGEGRKYKSTNDLAKSVIYKDKHIATLERENRELRERTGSNRTVEEILEKLKNNSNTSGEPLAEIKDTETLRPEDIVSKVVQELENREATNRAKGNLDTVKAKLAELYGRDYQRHLAELANEKGIPKETLDELAQRSPKGFFNVLGIDPAKSGKSLFGEAPRGSVEPLRPMSNAGKVRNKAYYDNLRKTDRATYFRADIQAQMHLDAIALKEQWHS